MNKLKTILFSVITILMMLSISVLAAESKLEITGDGEAKAGDTKTLMVKIVSEKDAGTIEGVISGDSNISSLEVSGENNWSAMYNSESKKFVLYKANGGKNENVMKVTYTISSEATEKATISLTGVVVTSTAYEDENVTDITKVITIPTNTPQQPEEEPTDPKDEPVEVTLSSIEVNKVPSKVEYTEGEKFDKTGMEILAKYNDGTSKKVTDYTFTPNGVLSTKDTKVVISYTENDVTKTAEQKIKVTAKPIQNTVNNTVNNNTVNNNTVNNKINTQQSPVVVIGGQSQTPNAPDNTVANKVLSKAGISDIAFYVIMLVVTVGVIFYIKYNKMKDVK